MYGGASDRGQRTENREQSTENRVQRTEYREQSTENRVQSTEYREQSTEYREQSTEYREQSTENRVNLPAISICQLPPNPLGSRPSSKRDNYIAYTKSPQNTYPCTHTQRGTIILLCCSTFRFPLSVFSFQFQ